MDETQRRAFMLQVITLISQIVFQTGFSSFKALFLTFPFSTAVINVEYQLFGCVTQSTKKYLSADPVWTKRSLIQFNLIYTTSVTSVMALAAAASLLTRREILFNYICETAEIRWKVLGQLYFTAFYLYYERCACDETANEDILVPQDPQTHFASLLLVKLSFKSFLVR